MIKLQPLGNVRGDLLDFLKHHLSEKFNTEVVILKPIDMPRECYNPMRKQYNSTCILRKLEASWITLAVTEEDLYADKLNFVFGEAELGGSRAIVSCYRLKFNASDELLKQRLLKEAVHELGHVFGLRHCSNRKCVMCFSNSIFDVDAKTDEFCEKCLRALRL